MNDSDLESKIKSLRVPGRGDDYWEAFPQQVLAELRAKPTEPPVHSSFLPELLWFGRLAFACLMAGFCLAQSPLPKAISRAIRNDEQELRQSITRVDYNLGQLMQDEHGLGNLIEDPR